MRLLAWCNTSDFYPSNVGFTLYIWKPSPLVRPLEPVRASVLAYVPSLPLCTPLHLCVLLLHPSNALSTSAHASQRTCAPPLVGVCALLLQTSVPPSSQACVPYPHRHVRPPSSQACVPYPANVRAPYRRVGPTPAAMYVLPPCRRACPTLVDVRAPFLARMHALSCWRARPPIIVDAFRRLVRPPYMGVCPPASVRTPLFVGVRALPQQVCSPSTPSCAPSVHVCTLLR